MVYKVDANFCAKCDELSLKFFYDLQQLEHVDLMDTHTKIPPEIKLLQSTLCMILCMNYCDINILFIEENIH